MLNKIVVLDLWLIGHGRVGGQVLQGLSAIHLVDGLGLANLKATLHTAELAVVAQLLCGFF